MKNYYMGIYCAIIAEAHSSAYFIKEIGSILLRNQTVTIFKRSFISNGLGFHVDAVLGVIPALGKQIPSVAYEQQLAITIESAKTHFLDKGSRLYLCSDRAPK